MHVVVVVVLAWNCRGCRGGGCNGCSQVVIVVVGAKRPADMGELLTQLVTILSILADV